MLVRRKREADLKSSRNSLRARHCNEQRMEVGAVPPLRIAGVEHIAVTPTSSGFVIFHGCKHVVVNGAGFLERSGLTLGDFRSQLGRQARDWYQRVGLQILLALFAGKRRSRQVRGRIERNSLATSDRIFDLKMQLGSRLSLRRCKIHIVTVFRFTSSLQRQVAFRGDDLYVLISIGLRCRNPDADCLPRRQILYCESIVKSELPGLLGSRKEGESGETE